MVKLPSENCVIPWPYVFQKCQILFPPALILMHSGCATFVCASSSPTVFAPQSWWGSTHGERTSCDNTIMMFMNTKKHVVGCQVEIGLISCRTSLNLVNGGASLTTILGTRVLAALVGHLVRLWGCVPSSPGEPPFIPLPCTLLKI